MVAAVDHRTRAVPEPRPGFRDYYARPIEKGSDTELLAQLRRRGELYRDRRETTIAGKPTVTFCGSGFDVFLSPGGDLAERGNLHIGLSPMGGRGVADRQTEAAVTPEQADAAVAAMAHTVRTYFV